MYSENDSYEIPFKLLTRKAAMKFGELIRTWAIEGPPDGAQVNDRSATISRDSFNKQLNGKGLEEQKDYSIRAGIENIELYLRESTTASFLMPEPEAITRFEQPGQHRVDLPTQYLEVLLSPQISELYRTPYANYPFQIDSDGYEEFLHPFMASYMCMQCA